MCDGSGLETLNLVPKSLKELLNIFKRKRNINMVINNASWHHLKMSHCGERLAQQADWDKHTRIYLNPYLILPSLQTADNLLLQYTETYRETARRADSLIRCHSKICRIWSRALWSLSEVKHLCCSKTLDLELLNVLHKVLLQVHTPPYWTWVK